MLNNDDLKAIEKVVGKVLDRKLKMNKSDRSYSDSAIELRKNFYTWLWHQNKKSRTSFQ